MTDSKTATERLREMLDERGIEWWDSRYGGQIVWQHDGVKWFANDGCKDGMVELTTVLVTPEQAIAATLGERRDRTKELLVEACNQATRDYVAELERKLEAATLGTEINGETSDGYHTFNELYHHRAVLFSVIVANHRDMAWKARKHHDGTMYDGMFIVGVDTPFGQASYHYGLDPYWDMFGCEEREFAPEWDGHTPDEAIERIGRLATLGNEVDGETWRSVALGLFAALERADLEMACRWIGSNAMLRDELAYGDAIAATLGTRTSADMSGKEPDCVRDGGEMSESRWHELFGSPERAARTLDAACSECSRTDCCDCKLDELKDFEIGYDALLEWLREGAVER